MKSLTTLTAYLRSSSQSLLLYSRTTIGPISHYHSKTPNSSRNVKVSVFWDFENCGIPNGMDALDVTKNITNALRANGIKGPVTITAFGDIIRLPILVQEKLSITGVSFNHVPNGGKNTADRCLLADLVFWVSQNPPPAYMFLISSDQDFADILHRLRMNNYSVLLASMDPVSGILASSASITWRWSQLVKGESLSGNHFNEPPDGPLGSWYSHSRKPLEDYIPDMGQRPNVQNEMRAIPLATIHQIRKLVNLYPNGVNISEFHAELLRTNVPLDKNLYGHKNFSLLLKSLPTVVKLQCTCEGRIIVWSIKRKFAEPDVQRKVAEPVDQSKVTRTCAQPKVAELSSCKLGECTDSEVNSASTSSVVTVESNDSNNAVTTDVTLSTYSPSKIETPSVGALDDQHITELGAMEQTYSIPKAGFFRRVWRNAFSHNCETSNKKKNSPEVCSTSADSPSNSKEPVSEEETLINPENEKSVPQMSIFGVIIQRYVSWTTSTEADNPDRNLREGVSDMSSGSERRPDSLHVEASIVNTGLSQTNIQTDDSELFSDEAFWESVLSFLHTPKGVTMITQSKTRRQMVEKLQKGPSHLRNLAIDDLSHLVALLIYEKKWIEETVSNAFPFRLIHRVQTMSSPSNPHKSIGFSSYFSNNVPLSNLRRPLAHELETGKKDTLSEVCSEVSQNRGAYKNGMLADCQKLVVDMVKENPEGFNMYILRKSFSERYGYPLSTQTLGYVNLELLLQSFPEVVIRGKFILPSDRSSKSMENAGSRKAGKDQDLDNVVKSILDIECLRSGNSNEGIAHLQYDNSVYLSEEDSDSDGESPIRKREEGSSLLQLLDSYHDRIGKDGVEGPGIKNWPAYSSGIDLKPSFGFRRKGGFEHFSPS